MEQGQPTRRTFHVHPAHAIAFSEIPPLSNKLGKTAHLSRSTRDHSNNQAPLPDCLGASPPAPPRHRAALGEAPDKPRNRYSSSSPRGRRRSAERRPGAAARAERVRGGDRGWRERTGRGSGRAAFPSFLVHRRPSAGLRKQRETRRNLENAVCPPAPGLRTSAARSQSPWGRNNARIDLVGSWCRVFQRGKVCAYRQGAELFYRHLTRSPPRSADEPPELTR